MFLEFFSTNTVAFVAAVFVLGLLVGSFLNVVIYRLPEMMKRQWQWEIADFQEDEETLKKLQNEPAFNLIKPDSSCPNCGHQIRAWENVPLASWLFLKGKCSACQNRFHHAIQLSS